VVIESGRLERGTRVQIMPDIVTVGNTRLQLKEGENFTLKCDVLPGTEIHALLQSSSKQGCGSAFI
jgi:hypothetical protein